MPIFVGAIVKKPIRKPSAVCEPRMFTFPKITTPVFDKYMHFGKK